MDHHRHQHSKHSKQFDLQPRRHQNRKHCKRKWSEAMEPLGGKIMGDEEEDVHQAEAAGDSQRCSRLLADVLERTQQELQRLKKLDGSGPSLNQNQIHLHPGSSSPVPFALAKRPVTEFLEAAMKRFIPDHYEARFRQEIDQDPSAPVFICTADFPAVPCPLFVCEPRYRLLVRRAVESGEKTFGIIQPNGGKSRYYDVGTILDIRDCVQLGDGCSILGAIGCKRFKILARNEKDGYETAKVEYICEEPIAEEQVKILDGMQSLVLAKASGWFESLSPEQKHEILQIYGQMPPLESNWELSSDGPAWAWWTIALLPLCQQLNVDILATTSLKKCLRAIDKTLDWLHDLSHPQQQQQVPQSPQQAHLDLDCEEQEAASSAAYECCLFAENSTEPHTDEELLL